MMDKNTKIYVNPTGRFVVGGPHGDAGVTGRKIIVDTYGGAAPHGGGAFSGKDPTKVDRSACYMARYIAKNVVAAGIADRALVQLAYAIGVADPVSVMVHTEGTGRIPEERITELVRAHFKLTPRGIMEELDLRRPIYKKTAAFGHFGRTEPEFTWERTDKAAALQIGIAASDRRMKRPRGDGGLRRPPSPILVALDAAAEAPSPWRTFPTARSRASSTFIRPVPTDPAALSEIAAAAATRGHPASSSSPITATRRAGPDPPEYRAGVLCLDAVEISTSGGHYIALGMGRLAVSARRRTARRRRRRSPARRLRDRRPPGFAKT